LGRSGRVSKGRGLSTFRVALLGLWLCSFLISIDVLSQLKPFDLVSPVALFFFRKELRVFLSSRLLVAQSMKWLLGIAVLSSGMTVMLSDSFLVLAVISLRLLRFAFYLAAFGILFAVPLTPKQRLHLVGCMAFGAVAEAFLIIFQWLGVIPILWPMHERIYTNLVPTGTLALNHVNNVVFMLTGIAALVTWNILNRKYLNWVAVGFGSAAMVAAIGLGEARLGIVGAPLLVISIVLALRGKGIVFAVSMALVAVLLGGSVLVGVMDTVSMVWTRRMVGKVGDTGQVTSYMEMDQSRSRIWKHTMWGIKARPYILVTGTGFQNFKVAVNGIAVAAHNLYLEVLVELGFPGALSFFGMIVGLVRQFRIGMLADQKTRDANAAALALLVTLLVLGMANETLYPKRPIPGFLGFVMGYWGLVAGLAPAKWHVVGRRNHRGLIGGGRFG